MDKSIVTKEYFFCSHCKTTKKIASLKETRPVKNNPNKIHYTCGSCVEWIAKKVVVSNDARKVNQSTSRIMKTNVDKYISNLNVKGD